MDIFLSPQEYRYRSVRDNCVSHRIINNFPQIKNCTILRLKLVLLASRWRWHGRADKTGLKILILHFYIRRKLDMIRYMIFQYGLELVLIQRILIGFEAEELLS